MNHSGAAFALLGLDPCVVVAANRVCRNSVPHNSLPCGQYVAAARCHAWLVVCLYCSNSSTACCCGEGDRLGELLRYLDAVLCHRPRLRALSSSQL